MRTLTLKWHAPVAVALLATASISNVFAHGDAEAPIHVAVNGSDAGSCGSILQPCATIGQALRSAGKGGEIRVLEGTYAVDDAEVLFHLISGAINVSGGFKKEGSAKLSRGGASILTGVPLEYRELLRGRGFDVIVDQKGLDSEKFDEATKLLDLHSSLKSSIPATPCVGGIAAGLPCESIDLLSHVGFADMNSNPSSGNDVWGFVDLNSMREYALAGFNVGTAVFDVTDPENPRQVGFIDGQDTIWRDVKVFQFFDPAADRWRAYAYVSADGSTDGLAVIDLSGLPHSISRVTYSSDILRAHNVYAADSDYSTGISITGNTPSLIVAGSNIGADEDNGRFRMYGLDDPTFPLFVGGAPAGSLADTYIHDASSVIITDARMIDCPNATTHCNVLLDFNENSVDLWDVTDATNPQLLTDPGRPNTYANPGYVHSGWATEDKQYVFVHDEFDEREGPLNTTLRAVSISDLNSPFHDATWRWTGTTRAIDHNGYVRGNRYYMSNYTRGLTILDITDPTAPVAVGNLDTYPFDDGTVSVFNGAWGAYPFFFSGNVAISDIDSGFYMAQDNTRDVPQGSFSFAAPSAAVEEGQQVQVAVQRNGGSTGGVSVNYELLSATAQSDDYQVTSGVLNWADGDTADKTIDITATGDGIGEGMEHVIVRLISPGGGATLANLSTASLYISDPGTASNVGFMESAIETTESGFGTLVAVLQRRGTALSAASVDYSMTAGDATPGSDFQGNTSGTVNWAAGDGDPKVLEFILNDDGAGEFDEFFELTLNNPIGATIAGSPTLTARIREGGVQPLPPPPPTPQPSGGSSGGAFGGWFLIVLGLLAVRRRLSRTGAA